VLGGREVPCSVHPDAPLFTHANPWQIADFWRILDTYVDRRESMNDVGGLARNAQRGLLTPKLKDVKKLYVEIVQVRKASERRLQDEEDEAEAEANEPCSKHVARCGSSLTAFAHTRLWRPCPQLWLAVTHLWSRKQCALSRPLGPTCRLLFTRRPSASCTPMVTPRVCPPMFTPRVWPPLFTPRVCPPLFTRVWLTLSSLVQLQNYVRLNGTGFRKIVKKFDKAMKRNSLPVFMETLKGRSFMEGSRLILLNERTTRLVSRDKLLEFRLLARQSVLDPGKGDSEKPYDLRAIGVSVALAAVTAGCEPFGNDEIASRAAGYLTLVVSLWLFKAVPFHVTAMVIPPLAVFCDVLRDGEGDTALAKEKAASLVLSSFFNHNTFLILGGYTISAAFSRVEFETRIAGYLQVRAICGRKAPTRTRYLRAKSAATRCSLANRRKRAETCWSNLPRAKSAARFASRFRS